MAVHRIIDEQEQSRVTSLIETIVLNHGKNIEIPFGNFLQGFEKLHFTRIEINKEGQNRLELVFRLPVTSGNGNGTSTPQEVLGDITDVLLFLPSSISVNATSTNILDNWVNLGVAGVTADLSTIPTWSNFAPRGVTTDAVIGAVVGYTATDEGMRTATTNSIINVVGTNDNSEMWILFKAGTTNVSGRIAEFSTGGGSATRWSWWGFNGPGSFSFNWVLTGVFRECPALYDDQEWHVFRTVHALDTDDLVMYVDGYPLDSDTTTSGIPAAIAGWFTIGDGGDIAGAIPDSQIAFIKLTDGLLSQGRARRMWKFLRDDWEISGIPADGTPLLAFVGTPSGQANIYRVPFLTGSEPSVMHNGGPSEGLGYTVRKDADQEFIYYPDASTGKLWRMGSGGDSRVRITTFSPPASKGRGVALNLVADEFYSTHATEGALLAKHSILLANADDDWTTLIASGTYEMHMAIEYHPSENKIYFIDSLAATPSLRTINPDGTGDTKIADLTAGKVYEYLVKDPDSNTLYFTNITDNTIEKYALDPSTHTTSWHIPTDQPNGIDVANGMLWYFESVSYKVYEVALNNPGAKTERGDMTVRNPGDAGGLAINIFRTT